MTILDADGNPTRQPGNVLLNKQVRARAILRGWDARYPNISDHNLLTDFVERGCRFIDEKQVDRVRKCFSVIQNHYAIRLAVLEITVDNQITVYKRAKEENELLREKMDFVKKSNPLKFYIKLFFNFLKRRTAKKKP